MACHTPTRAIHPWFFMTTTALIFPHQLFDDHPTLESKPGDVLLLEEPLFFDDPRYAARFHKQKLAYHRTTMVRYAERLETRGYSVRHVKTRRDVDFLAKELSAAKKRGANKITVVDPHDFTLSKRLHEAAKVEGLPLEILATPAFLNTPDLNREYRDGKKRWFMADFYKWQRKRLNIMMDSDAQPEGGQ